MGLNHCSTTSTRQRPERPCKPAANVFAGSSREPLPSTAISMSGSPRYCPLQDESLGSTPAENPLHGSA